MEAALGFEPRNNGFAIRRLGPLGYAAVRAEPPARKEREERGYRRSRGGQPRPTELTSAGYTSDAQRRVRRWHEPCRSKESCETFLPTSSCCASAPSCGSSASSG